MRIECCSNCGENKPLYIEFLCRDGRIQFLCYDCSYKFLDSDLEYHREDIKKLLEKIP